MRFEDLSQEELLSFAKAGRALARALQAENRRLIAEHTHKCHQINILTNDLEALKKTLEKAGIKHVARRPEVIEEQP